MHCPSTDVAWASTPPSHLLLCQGSQALGVRPSFHITHSQEVSGSSSPISLGRRVPQEDLAATTSLLEDRIFFSTQPSLSKPYLQTKLIFSLGSFISLNILSA